MNKIKALCSVNEITLKRLGEDLKIKPNDLSNYSTEARSLPVETAYEIAKYFDVSMEYVCGYKDREEKSSLPEQRKLMEHLTKIANDSLPGFNSKVSESLSSIELDNPYLVKPYLNILFTKLMEDGNISKINFKRGQRL